MAEKEDFIGQIFFVTSKKCKQCNADSSMFNINSETIDISPQKRNKNRLEANLFSLIQNTYKFMSNNGLYLLEAIIQWWPSKHASLGQFMTGFHWILSVSYLSIVNSKIEMNHLYIFIIRCINVTLIILSLIYIEQLFKTYYWRISPWSMLCFFIFYLLKKRGFNCLCLCLTVTWTSAYKFDKVHWRVYHGW